MIVGEARTNTRYLVKSHFTLSADFLEELQLHFKNEIGKKYQTKRNLEDKASEHILE